MKNFTLLLVILLVGIIRPSRAQDTRFIFEKNDVKPGFVAASKQYNDSSFLGFASGGAELYLEYGFKSLNHQEIVYRNLFFKADIYEMKDSAAAYGIYSVSVVNCAERGELTTYDCINTRQLQFCTGPYYVSISNVRGDTNAVAAAKELASRLIKKRNFPAFSPGMLFQSKLISDYQSNIKVINGPQGLQNGYPGWVDRFEGMKDYYITMLPAVDSGGSFVLARLSFGKAGDMQAFRKACGIDQTVNRSYWKKPDGDKWFGMIKLDDFNCLYLETNKQHKIFMDLVNGFDTIGTKSGSQKE